MSNPIIEQIENFGLSSKDRPKADFAEVGIVGCGGTGQFLSVMIASKGIEVVFLEVSQERIDLAFREIEELLTTQINQWSLTKGEKRAVLSRIKGTLDYRDFKNCDLVIESILLAETQKKPIDIRKEIFLNIEEHVSPHAIIATNSTTLAITELASFLKYRDRCVSIHISTTFPGAALIEVVRSLYTSDETFSNVQKFAIYINKKIIEVEESPGLITVRLVAPLLNKACRILLEGVAKMEKIDIAMKQSLNIPLGPFEMADKIGIKKVIRWLDTLYDEFGDTQYKASPILKKLSRSNQTGRAARIGFYEYTKHGEIIKPSKLFI